MSKKGYLIFCVLGVLIIIASIVFILYNPSKINISNCENATIIYMYGDKIIDKPIDKKDMLIIRDILDGKELYKDSPSCGFDANISLRFDNNTFSVACDGCSIIKYRNKFLDLSESEIEQIHNIMKKYGAKFPCI